MQALTSLVRRSRADPNAEVEVRLGTHRNRHFHPGVSRDVFEQLEKDLIESALVPDPSWTELVDYHYTTKRARNVRTRVEFDSDEMEVGQTHIVKTRGASVLLSPTEAPGDACRVAYSIETPLEDPPATCLPTFVRVKQRRCFADVREGHVIWSYELSKTWSGASRSVVEHMQHNSEPTYEVECELVDAERTYRGTRSDEEVASSLLLKATMLVGCEGTADMETILSDV